MIIAFNIIAFATLVFVIYRIFKRLELKLERNSDELWGHIERRYNDSWQHIDWKTHGIEFRITESETTIRDVERDVSKIECGGET